jgi:hypothetical protein
MAFRSIQSVFRDEMRRRYVPGCGTARRAESNRVAIDADM